MKKVLGLIGSPRRGGNCENMIKEISRQIPEPHQLKLLRIPDFDIQSCNGCYSCLFKPTCIIKDQFEVALAAIAEADAMIVAAPTYYLSAHSSLKGFTDRGLAFYNHHESLWDKPAIGIGIAGMPGKEGKTALDIEHFLMAFLAQVKGVEIIYGALPGEALMRGENLEIAARLGKALFREKTPQNAASCNLCGGTTFRFGSQTQVQCMICSNSGTIEITPEGPRFHIQVSNVPLMLSKESALEHRDWLRGMKQRFAENKDELKQVKNEYRNDGEWVRPPQPTNTADLC